MAVGSLLVDLFLAAVDRLPLLCMEIVLNSSQVANVCPTFLRSEWVVRSEASLVDIAVLLQKPVDHASIRSLSKKSDACEI